jgi:MFS family permease
VAFFQVAYVLQDGAAWSALAAGIGLLPTTVLMLIGSAGSGALAARIGPRPQLVAGPLLAAAGLLLLARITIEAHWVGQVLPGAVLLGVGLVVFVAPLTATALGSVSADHLSVSSGVNNAIARTAGLAALSVVPVISGLKTATDPQPLVDASRTTLLIAAGVAAVAAPVAWFGLPPHDTHMRRSWRRTHCPVDGPPLQCEEDGATGPRATAPTVRAG